MSNWTLRSDEKNPANVNDLMTKVTRKMKKFSHTRFCELSDAQNAESEENMRVVNYELREIRGLLQENFEFNSNNLSVIKFENQGVEKVIEKFSKEISSLKNS
jgi:23S rRNA pseudoU1915 N3-methylase RlmH